MRHIVLPIVFLFYLFATSFTITSLSAAEEDKAHFNELTVVLTKDDLLLFANLENSITPEMKEILQSGLPLDFTFTIELYRPTAGASERLHAENFIHTISYDTLSNEYKVNYSENGRVETYQDLAAATKAVDSINGMKVLPVGQLIPDNRYSLRMQADLFHKTLPPGLTSIIPFISWDDRKTDWQEVNFRY